jgi:sortase A
MRRLIRDISSVLIISGLLLMLDAGVTLLWQEPVTAVIGTIQRGEINTRFLSLETTPLSPIDTHALGSVTSQKDRISYLARREARQVSTGDAIGRIVIPKIDASYDVVQGTDTSSLEKGPGHYPATALPGLGQTVAIAGHRTTYLAPFRHIDELKPGDRIVLTMPYARFTYLVQYHRIVLPTALWVTKDVGYDRLVLSACNPLYSAAQRIIVFAKLSQVEPLGAARAIAWLSRSRSAS